MCGQYDDPSQHDVTRRGAAIIADAIEHERALPEIWCSLCPNAATSMQTEPNGTRVAICAGHFQSGPCDDCGYWVGHNHEIEH